MKAILKFFGSAFFIVISQFIVYFPFIVITDYFNLGWIPFIILGFVYYFISNVFFPLIGSLLDIAFWIWGVFLLKEAGGIIFTVYVVAFVLYLLIMAAKCFASAD